MPVGGTVMPMTRSPDHHRLYAALRSTRYRVVSFAINPLDGRLIELGRAPLADSMAHVSTDPSGNYLLAAGQLSPTLAVYRIDPGTGRLDEIGKYPVGKGANWVEIVTYDGVN
ncbi:beta-propeller fold lactonase family protein [Burkholderia sp. BE17]|uniref:beta-propeller fold lactonase family protein n=1 Tax=Burkholderia sp. BE17 TaxID=2656644 RepID=UPI002AB2702A|nr:beta-propeller fold lactonase family protein [Burkholderia sp. BE17]